MRTTDSSPPADSRPNSRQRRLSLEGSIRLGLAVLAAGSSLALAGSDPGPVQLPPARQSPAPLGLPVSPFAHSVARVWNEALLDAIRRDSPRPSVHARNLFHASAAMYDAWAAFSASDSAFLHAESFDASGLDLDAARRTAVSYACYRLLSHRFERSPGHEASQAVFDAVMSALGLDIGFEDTAGPTPAALGNRVAETYIQHGLADGSNEPGNYSDSVGYNPINVPMLVVLPGTGGLADINAWQPLIPPAAAGPQTFLTPQWYRVAPFALERPAPAEPYLDPGAPPHLGGDGDGQLRETVIELIEFGSTLDIADGVEINISPSVTGNNPLGSNDGQGHAVNPATGAPYPDNWVLRGDWSRVLAEFWADGPLSSTPPGHWNEIANTVSDALEVKRLGGQGAPLDDLEWDIKLYMALNGAAHDAAIASWEVKYLYESSRPITLIRGMAEQGQSSDPSHASYDPQGLPLEPGLIELITPESSAPGERHEHLADHVGEIAVLGWLGHPDDPDNQIGGVDWIRGVEWLPYQARNFVTPPFPGYVSGHSTFSRAAAEVLAGLTGDAFFPGGYGEFEVAVGGDFDLDFEFGPSEPVALQWATYFDASDEAGLSRIYGGIHPRFDDLPGRIIGHEVGTAALERALDLYAPAGLEPAPATPLPVPVAAPWALVLLGLGTGWLGARRIRSDA